MAYTYRYTVVQMLWIISQKPEAYSCLEYGRYLSFSIFVSFNILFENTACHKLKIVGEVGDLSRRVGKEIDEKQGTRGCRVTPGRAEYLIKILRNRGWSCIKLIVPIFLLCTQGPSRKVGKLKPWYFRFFEIAWKRRLEPQELMLRRKNQYNRCSLVSSYG